MAETLAAAGCCVIGEYLDAEADGTAALPVDQHPLVSDDDAHQDNWIRKAAQAKIALGQDITVFSDRDWLSSLAYAYSLADGADLLAERASWAKRNLHDGNLLLGDVYVILHLAVPVSLQRRSTRLRPEHPWSSPAVLDRLATFYRSPAQIIGSIEPALGELIAQTSVLHISGLEPPSRNLRLVRRLGRTP
ncbi:hypothetical protein J4573_08450 [Actinomadura barringtoniae]|uniref:Uncharacterized protein n=2 Tax=Actinomadura barringtoniae TaxID=1427535 RepID=A0A939T8P0_9ACTN|nr:hypothetical protein [Actinomadura barringtoniae]